MKALKRFILLAVVVAGVAFSFPKYYFSKKPVCVVNDPVLAGHKYQEQAYRDRVYDILDESRPQDFRYFFVTFTGDDHDQVVISMRNSEYCFDAIMSVENQEYLDAMMASNGVSFPEELYRVQWELRHQADRRYLAFLGMRRIID